MKVLSNCMHVFLLLRPTSWPWGQCQAGPSLPSSPTASPPAHRPGPNFCPQCHQPLPQQCHNRASLQLPSALPCPAINPTELGQHTGRWPGLALAYHHPHVPAQPSQSFVWPCYLSLDLILDVPAWPQPAPIPREVPDAWGWDRGWALAAWPCPRGHHIVTLIALVLGITLAPCPCSALASNFCHAHWPTEKGFWSSPSTTLKPEVMQPVLFNDIRRSRVDHWTIYECRCKGSQKQLRYWTP